MLNPFYEAVAWLIVHIHDGLSHVLPSGGGAAWALSIVFLTIAMRILLIPIFVKQIQNSRQMQLLQPKMKELQAKYKNDKEKLNQEMMALWRENGANPLAGCLPLVVQIPVFIALFRVLNSLKPNSGCTDVHAANCFSAQYGISASDVAHAAQAKVFSVPISAAFSSSSTTLHLLGASATTTKIMAAALIVLMGLTTFFTQRQLMARSAATSGTQMAQQQKILLYVLPFTFVIFGPRFPLGVLLYWLTTNFWSMGQQAIVIRKMDAAPAAAAAGKTAPAGPAPGAKPIRSAPPTPAPAPKPEPPEEPNGVPPPRSSPARPSSNRRPANRKRSRRGRR